MSTTFIILLFNYLSNKIFFKIISKLINLTKVVAEIIYIQHTCCRNMWPTFFFFWFFEREFLLGFGKWEMVYMGTYRLLAPHVFGCITKVRRAKGLHYSRGEKRTKFMTFITKGCLENAWIIETLTACSHWHNCREYNM